MLQLHSQLFPTPQFFLECFDFSGEKGLELTVSHFQVGSKVIPHRNRSSQWARALYLIVLTPLNKHHLSP